MIHLLILNFIKCLDLTTNIFLETQMNTGYIFDLPTSHLIDILYEKNHISDYIGFNYLVDITDISANIQGTINNSCLFKDNGVDQKQFLYIENSTFQNNALDLKSETYFQRINDSVDLICFTPEINFKILDTKEFAVLLEAKGTSIDDFVDLVIDDFVNPLLADRGLEICNKICYDLFNFSENNVALLLAKSKAFFIYFIDDKELFTLFNIMRNHLEHSTDFNITDFLVPFVHEKIIDNLNNLNVFFDKMSITSEQKKYLWTFWLAIQDIYNIMELAINPEHIFQIYNFTKLPKRIVGHETLVVEIDAEKLPNQDISTIEVLSNDGQILSVYHKDVHGGVASFYLLKSYLKTQNADSIKFSGIIDNTVYETEYTKIE